jgi:glucose/arabinose dehydrogenase
MNFLFGRIAVGCVGTMFIVGSNVGVSKEPIQLSAGVQTYWVEQVTEGLNFPSSMAWLPNGDALLTERTGDLRILSNGKLNPKPVSGTPPCFYNGFDGLEGHRSRS